MPTVCQSGNCIVNTSHLLVSTSVETLQDPDPYSKILEKGRSQSLKMWLRPPLLLRCHQRWTLDWSWIGSWQWRNFMNLDWTRWQAKFLTCFWFSVILLLRIKKYSLAITFLMCVV